MISSACPTTAICCTRSAKSEAVAMVDSNAPVEVFGPFSHHPESGRWPRPRQVIFKTLHRPGQDQRVRFFVTSLNWDTPLVIREVKAFPNDRNAMARAIYQNIYCPRRTVPKHLLCHLAGLARADIDRSYRHTERTNRRPGKGFHMPCLRQNNAIGCASKIIFPPASPRVRQANFSPENQTREDKISR